MIKAILLILGGLMNGLFVFLRPSFYWEDPRIRLFRRWVGDTRAIVIVAVLSAGSVILGLYFLDGEAEGSRLAAASLLAQSGRPGRACAEIRDLLAEEPDNAEAWSVLGTIEQQRGRLAFADTAYRNALSIDVSLVQPRVGLGILAAGSGRLDEADAHFRIAIATDSTCAEAYSHLAMLDLKRYRDTEALAHAQQAFELDRSSPAITANLAVAYHYNGRTAERDMMRRVARSLRFNNDSLLARVFDGRMTLRDERYAPHTP